MPIVNIPEIGRVRFPDEMSDADIVKAIQNNILKQPPKEPSVKDYLKDVPKALGRGAVGLLETSGIGASALLPEEYEQKVRSGIESVAKPAKEFLAPSTPELGESVPSKLVSGLGSTLPFFLTGPFGLAGRAAAGALGVSAGAGEARQAAEQAGATKEERGTATLLGAPTGLLDILAPNIGPLKNIFSTALARGGIEGLTEASQKVAQNLIAQGVYNPKQDVLAGSAEEGAYGAGVGALASLLVDMTLGRRSKGASVQERPPAAPARAPEVEAPPPQVALPEATGFSAEQAQALRQDAALAEEARLSGVAEAERERLAQIEQEMQATQERSRGLPGMTGLPNINTDLMGAMRDREQQQLEAQQAELIAEQARKQEEYNAQVAQYQAQVSAIQNSTYSSDPVQNQIVKDRLLNNLPQPGVNPASLETFPVTEGKPLEEPAGLYAPNEPLFKEPQAKPRGATAFNQLPEEKQEIADLKTDLATVKRDIAEASKKENKGNLFNFLKDKLVDRPGAFGLSDIDPDNKKLQQMYNKQGQGVLLEDMVSDGALDEYLPFNQRAVINGQKNPNFDTSNALEHIAGKLRSGDYATESFNNEMSVLAEQKDRLETEIERLSAMPGVNLELAGRAGRPRAAVEPVATQDLEDQARNTGLDVDGIKEEIAMRMPDATQEQYLGSFRNALESGIRQRQGAIVDTLQSVSGGSETGIGTKEGKLVQNSLEGKTFNEAIDWTIKTAPNSFQRLVAQKVKAMVQALQRQGVDMRFEVQGGNARNSSLYRAEGVTTYIFDQNNTQVTVLLNGEPVFKNQLGYPSGMNYETVQHEFLHVATRSAIRFLPKSHPVIKDLNNLYEKVYKQYEKDLKAGTLPDVMRDFSRRTNNVLDNADELLTWGLTDKRVQQYLDGINVGPKQTAFNKLVSLVRELLGMPKPFETALEKLIRTTDEILSMDAAVVGRALEAEGYSFGKPQVAQKIPEQMSLFKRGERLLRDDLSVRKNGFYFDAKQSPLYQTRTAEEVGDFSQQEADKIVALDKRAREIQAEKRWVGKLKDGAWVGTRLDLVVYKAAKKQGLPPVLTIQEGKESLHTKSGFSKGELLRLVPHVTLRNVRFNVYQGERERIAEGGEKGRMASADGQYVNEAPNFDGIEVSFNPAREHLFRDALGRAIKYADEVTALKNRMYVRGNIEYYGAEDVPALPTQPSDAWIMGSGQDARKLEQRPAIIDDGGKVSKEQQNSLFNGQEIIQDSLFSRREGFFIDAKQSPLYQKRTAADVPVITQELAERALATHSKGARVEGKGIQLKPGDYIGARLDLPIRSSSKNIMSGGVPLQAIHMGNPTNYARDDGGFWNGKIAKYLPSVTMKNVKFRVDQERREATAAGLKKEPMGSADGQFVRSDNPNFDGIELRFNPKREHLFVDAMGRAVKYADEVTTMGDRSYARGYIEYFGDEDFVRPTGKSPTQAKVMTEQEALQQAGPEVERAVQESSRTGKPLSAPIQDSLFAINAPSSQIQESLFKQEPNTPAFKKWFGNSKVVDKNGKPLIVYHGTSKDFTRFAPEKSADGVFHFTLNKDTASRFAISRAEDGQAGANVLPVYLSIKNPKMVPFINTMEIQQAIAEGHDGLIDQKKGHFVAFKPNQIKSAIGNRGTYAPAISDISMRKAATPVRTAAGNDGMEILAGLGRFVKEPEPGYVEQVSQAWDNAVDNPKLTREQALGSFRKYADQVETWAFSSDAALNNQIRREVMNSTKGQEEKTGMLLNASLSQTVHSDAVSNLFIMKGNIKWDEKLHKWTGVDDENNIITLSRQLDEIADKHGLSKEEIELIAHTAFEAKRTESLIRQNQRIDEEVAAIRAEAAAVRGRSPVAASELSDKASKLSQKKIQLQFEGEELAQFIKAGRTQFEIFPELRNVVKTWDGIRENALNVMVETGLYSRQEAEQLMSNADYVPFFREDQIEEGKGPKEFLRSLSVQADKRIKGSKKPVNDIFDNMVRWTQYAINRGVRNRSALALVNTAESIGLARKIKDADSKESLGFVGVDEDNNPIIGKISSGAQAFNSLRQATAANKNLDGFEVAELKDAEGKTKYVLTPEVAKENVVKVWDGGKQVEYSMADPMFISAFRGLESVAIPTVKFFSKFADVLRQSIVLYPLFSVAQVPQDSFAAMFTSGLKPQHALTIPVRAVKEFIQTLRGKSKAHEELKNVGATGVRDFTSSIIRADAEIMSGLKKDASIWGSVKRKLGTLAMAADNAVRQATYEAALAQGLSRAEAIEKAFEIFNVRRRGNSQMLAMAGQVIPFFNAYLAAQHVAYRTLTGVGTSPTERKAAMQTLAATTGSVMALSVIYAMMMGDDEGYEKKATPTRDRLLMIPGTNGLGIPLRADIFALPKVLAEHVYHLITENGMTDAGKFRASMASILESSIFSPTPVPQAVKPIAEAVMNYDFFQQKPLVGIFQNQKELSRQFEDSTSEFSKVLGKTEMISPIVADHLIRGMFGSFGGLFLYMTNPMLAAMSGTTRPSVSYQDALATIPNASAFVSKEYEVGLRKDFYALKEVTDRAAMTMSDLKNRSPQEIADYLEDPKVKQRLALSPAVNKVANQLTTIRKQINLITNVETERMSSSEKEEQIKKLREKEYQLLKNVNLRKLREMAQV
jgi:hypothetical protein